MFLKRWKKNEIEFFCIACQQTFIQDVGEVSFDEDDDLPKFAKSINCPTCSSEYTGAKNNFSTFFELTELGQSQLTSIYMKGA